MHPPSRGLGRALAAGAVIALALASGAAAEERRGADSPFGLGLWPLYMEDAVAWAGVREGRAVGPFVHWERQAGERRFEARPLLSTRSSDSLDRVDVLYPVAARRVTPDRRQSWLFWLARSRRDADGPRHWFLGPFFRGRDEAGRGSTGLFPIWGTFRGWFGFDRLRFSLWPLYAVGEKGSYRETQLLWPFFAFGRGGGREKLRIWPLFGRDRVAGRYEHRFWLWPIFHRRSDALDSETPKRAFYAIPFYGRSDHGSRHMRFYAFPLYAHRFDDDDRDRWQRDIVWPLFHRARDGDVGRLAVRPLWFAKRSTEHQSWSALLGLAGRSRTETEGLHENWWRAFWLGRFGERREANQRIRRSELWPLWRRASVRGPDGRERGFARVPWLFPMKGLDPDGWDRHYNKLFELYGARWLDVEHRSSALFGLRESRSRPGLRWVQWGGFWSHATVDPD